MWSFLHSIYVGSLGLLNPGVYFLLWAWGVGGIISLSKLPVPLGGVRAQEWCWVQGEHAPGLRGVSGASSGGHMLHSRCLCGLWQQVHTGQVWHFSGTQVLCPQRLGCRVLGHEGPRSSWRTHKAGVLSSLNCVARGRDGG